MVVQHLLKFSNVLGPAYVPISENMLLIYIYGLICSLVTLMICETAVRGLHGVSIGSLTFDGMGIGDNGEMVV